ncbi:MAG: MBOAT family protein, partial [Schleiferiaceae bacterium]|nr:MBOAT family protein [Schleiferiaceae bacterium]
FWIFLGIVLAGYSVVYKSNPVRNAYLFFVSLFFYYKTSGFYFIILLFSTLADFIIGKQIYRTKAENGRKLWLVASIVVNLSILVFFKYAYFFADFINDAFGVEITVYNYFAWATNQVIGTDFIWEKIALPVGISFFTFQTISYSVDIYRGHIKPVKSILDFGFYVSFFPQLVAGPIVRAADFIPQLYKKYSLTKEEFGMGLFWILNGLVKKMFLADYVAVNFVDRVFANPASYSGFESVMALFGYTLQVYADFSGYTDIAIGVALWMGFRLPVNFNSPYKATSVSDFWRRWHISLSSWLRDYLYIPMGGNRGGSFFSWFMMGIIIFFVSLLANTWMVPIGIAGVVAAVAVATRLSYKFNNWISTNVNLMLTMLWGGLWHGASWNFVVWGGLNGLGLVVYKLWKKVSPWADRSKWYNRAIGIFITLCFITFTRTWFRSNSWEGAKTMLYQIVNNFKPEIIPDVIVAFNKVFIVMLLGFLIHWIPSTIKEKYRKAFSTAPVALQILVALGSIFFVYQIVSSDLQPFIYFDF